MVGVQRREVVLLVIAYHSFLFPLGHKYKNYITNFAEITRFILKPHSAASSASLDEPLLEHEQQIVRYFLENGTGTFYFFAFSLFALSSAELIDRDRENLNAIFYILIISQLFTLVSTKRNNVKSA